MNLQEIRERIRELSGDNSSATRGEAELFLTSVIDGLPRNAETAKELTWAYEQIIQRRLEEGRSARAMRVFRQYIDDCAPACDEAYNRNYLDGLLATGMPAVPLKRRDRFYSLVQLFRKTLELEGLVAECGCFRGLSSYLLCATFRDADPGFDGNGYRIFDSFEGLSAPRAEDRVEGAGPEVETLRQMTQQGYFSASLDWVKKSLQSFPGIQYYPGWIPQAFPDEPTARYRFVHVDVDVYQPTRDCFEYFYERLVPGGIIVSDDYNWPGARKAIEEFCARTGAVFEVTPLSQAYIVRR